MTSKYDNIPTHDQLAKEANLPTKVKIEELVDEPIVIMEREPGTARIPETGQETQGYWTIAIRESDDERVTFFVGQVVLVKELRALNPPFRTTIKRDGPAYEFH